MSTLVELRKSFINGEWRPITSVPKDELRAARRARRIGPQHGELTDAFTNEALREATRGAPNRRSISRRVRIVNRTRAQNPERWMRAAEDLWGVNYRNSDALIRATHQNTDAMTRQIQSHAPKPPGGSGRGKLIAIGVAGAAGVAGGGYLIHRSRKRKAELRKSFVDGEWKAISRVPKRELLDAVRGKRFGQKHLSEISRAKNSVLRQSAGVSEMRRSASKPTGRLIHNPFTGRKMEEISTGSLAGPHVNWAHTPGQRTQIRINNESHQEVRDNLKHIHGTGTKMSTNRGLINLHEMAHGMVKRPFPTRQASVLNRAWSQNPQDTARVVTLMNHGGSLTGKQKAAAFASVTRVNGNLHAVDAHQMLGEEARADVMASRKAKRLMVSGHVTDSGDPRDYLRRRNEIESRMGVPRTRMDQVFGQPDAPKQTKRRLVKERVR